MLLVDLFAATFREPLHGVPSDGAHGASPNLTNGTRLPIIANNWGLPDVDAFGQLSTAAVFGTEWVVFPLSFGLTRRIAINGWVLVRSANETRPPNRD